MFLKIRHSFNRSHGLLAVMLASLLSASAQAEEKAPSPFRFSALPQFGYVGEPITIKVEGGKDTLEYRALTREPDTDWNFDKEWVKATTLTVTPASTDLMSVDVQVRDPQSGDMLENKYLGDVRVFEKDEAMQLVSWPIQRFEMHEVPSTLSFKGSELDWRKSIRSTADFGRFIRAHVKPDDTRAITPSDQGAYALTALQIVSGLWHYGNYKNPLAPGCVAINETLASPRTGLTVTDYLSSGIGCCTDYAAMLGAALQAEGLEHRIVELPTHVFNEVKIDGIWWTLDANINVAYKNSWDHVVDGRSPVTLYRFQSASVSLGSRIYSDGAADFQTITLMQAAAGLLSDYRRREYVAFLNGNLADVKAKD